MFVLAENLADVLELELFLGNLFVMRDAMKILLVAQIFNIFEGNCASFVVNSWEKALELLTCF